MNKIFLYWCDLGFPYQEGGLLELQSREIDRTASKKAIPTIIIKKLD